MIEVTVKAPSFSATKQLCVTKYESGRRKIQISSNLLRLFDFKKGTKVYEEPIGENMGYMIRKAEGVPLSRKPKRIYRRVYKRRKNQPFEEVFETTSKAILDSSIPQNCERVHITITATGIRVAPIRNLTAERIAKTLMNPYTVTGVCTAGMDLYAASKAGFDIDTVVTYRPIEARDNTDLSESNAIACLENLSIRNLVNEDVSKIDPEVLKIITKQRASLCTISLECDDASLAKSQSLKQRSLQNSSSNIDMVHDALNIISALNPAMILVEQVSEWSKMQVAEIWDLRLRKLGYRTFSTVLDARDFGGLSRRKRFFQFATSLPVEFEFPKPIPSVPNRVWDQLFVPFIGKMRCINHSKSLQKGLEKGRIRVITPESTCTPTLLRSQSRVCKDSVVFMDAMGDLWWPTLEQERLMMSIPDDYALNAQSSSIASEILGQGVCIRKYQALMTSIKQHVDLFLQQQQIPLISV